MLISGGLCGLAGAVEYTGVLGRLYENWSPGYGFTAIAVALLGQLHPLGQLASALFFGALNAGSGTMERTAHVSSVLVYVVQATSLITLLTAQNILKNPEFGDKFWSRLKIAVRKPV